MGIPMMPCKKMLNKEESFAMWFGSSRLMNKRQASSKANNIHGGSIASGKSIGTKIRQHHLPHPLCFLAMTRNQTLPEKLPQRIRPPHGHQLVLVPKQELVTRRTTQHSHTVAKQRRLEHLRTSVFLNPFLIESLGNSI
ncbi:hypothetical protein HanXRQr2_Chr14g0637431 [Helianthus annuus]|uniref:Uncharacterized protein n=1 Tax=Helianthus annuus TaxID=4232 RepID=A0A9K3E898_HELAN|nr:hypothetical protein HanXRQr2_Chr14g0637431 [Helianthus annuus]KAJ0839824.1 hypothetical protein HanPSC8_Chr14g0611421 [Helianthus annuus]